MKFSVIILLISFLLSCQRQHQQANIDIVFLTYGLPDFNTQAARDSVGKKWGISFYAVAGCIVTNELVDSVRIHNLKISKLVSAKFGNDWQQKFEQEVKEYSKCDTKQ